MPHVDAWRARIAAIGHGERLEMTSREALDVAKVASPALPRNSDLSPNLKPGDRVSMATEGFGPDPVQGEIVATTEEAVVLRRIDNDIGEVAVHLPRLGYQASQAAPV